MFTPLHNKIKSYKANKDNKHPAFIERNGLQDIVDEIKEELINALPHGSGIDCDWTIEQGIDLTFKCYNSYHAMDQNGSYCGYVRFELTIDLNTFELLSLSCDQEDIDSIYAEYNIDEKTATEEEIEEWNETNACPYLDDLEDYLYETIEHTLEYYVVENTVKYAKEVHPWIFDRFTRNN